RDLKERDRDDVTDPSLDLVIVRIPGQLLDYRQLLRKFVQAANDSRFEEARQLLDEGAGFDAEGNLLLDFGSNVLHVAVRGRLNDLALHLISQGVDLESCNEMGRTPLVQACIKNTPEVITALLAARADVNIKDSSGRSAVYYAAMKENAIVVQQLIEAGAGPEELEMLGYSGNPHCPLVFHVDLQQGKTLKIGEDCNARKPSKKGDYRWSSLANPAMKVLQARARDTNYNPPYLQSLQSLVVSAGAEMQEHTPRLLGARAFNSAEAVQQDAAGPASAAVVPDAALHLQEEASRAEEAESSVCPESLYWILEEQDASSDVPRVLTIGVTVSSRTLGGREVCFQIGAWETVLSVKRRVASELRVPDFTIQLVQQGVTLKSETMLKELLRDDVTDPSLDLVIVRIPGQLLDYRQLLRKLVQAAKDSRFEEARQLLDEGAGFDAEGNLLLDFGSNVLHVAVRGRLNDLALHLISQGVDLESCNEMGRTPLVQACIKNTPEVITALLAARADVNIKDSSGRSAVYYAAMKENAAVVQQLIEAGADPEELENVDLESCNEMGRTPLVQACIKNAPEVITALLAARADVNIKDSSGRSAVYYAAMKENAAAVQQLIEAGADPKELEMLGCSGLRPLQTPKNWRSYLTCWAPWKMCPASAAVVPDAALHLQEEASRAEEAESSVAQNSPSAWQKTAEDISREAEYSSSQSPQRQWRSSRRAYGGSLDLLVLRKCASPTLYARVL
ncbi:invs, partial [Symbiodinium necroappetens]